MKIVATNIALASLTFFLLGCASAPLSDSSRTAFLGDWRSTALEGSDSGDFIDSIKISFRETSEFSATATMTDGSQDTKNGIWSIENDRLTMKVGGESQTLEFEWRDDLLVIHDPEIDSRVILEQQTPRTNRVIQ